MKNFQMVTIGSATRDVILRSRAIQIIRDENFSTGEGECFALGSKIEVDDIVFETGGGATNTAVGFSRLGFRTACIGKIGHRDSRGQALLRELAREKVNTQAISVDRQKMTAYSAILLTPRGERTVLVYRGASAHISASDIKLSTLRTPWLYVTSLGGQAEPIRKIWSLARAKKIRIAWNPGAGELALGLRRLRPWLRQAEIVSLNQEEVTGLFGLDRFQHREAFNRLRQLIGGVVVVTLGTDGALAGNLEQTWLSSTHNIQVTDTTGAGDAFGCGFTAIYIRQRGDIKRALQFGSANSESVIQDLGAKAGLLRKLQLSNPVQVRALT